MSNYRPSSLFFFPYSISSTGTFLLEKEKFIIGEGNDFGQYDIIHDK